MPAQNRPTELATAIRTAEITVESYMARYRDAGRFMAFCRQCGNYGHSWACPPFDSEAEQKLSIWRNALIVAVSRRIEPGHCVDDAMNLMRPARLSLEKMLLGLERKYGGMAFGFSGQCLYCRQCTRGQGEACRHPELVRPALEAYGFDVGRTAEELLGIRLQWAAGGKLPQQLTLVGALFHNMPLNSIVPDTSALTAGCAVQP